MIMVSIFLGNDISLIKEIGINSIKCGIKGISTDRQTDKIFIK